jgi:hypothetical protein
MKLAGQLMLREEVTAGDRAAMLALMRRHYVNVQPSVFFSDLDEKRWVIVVREPATGALCGFSTQTLLEIELDGQVVRALFSGDTIIDRQHWGDPALSHVWGQFALSLIDRYGDEPLYWFLLSQGFRTYRFLPLFFHEFYPRSGNAMQQELEAAVRALASSRYGSHFDLAAGVVRSHPQQYSLRDGVADITTERLRNEHVRFFRDANPGHARGDELCCIAPLTRENFTAAAYRVIGAEASLVELP